MSFQGNALQIRPKVEFIDSGTQNKASIGNVQIYSPGNKEAPDPLAYTNTIVVHQNFGQPAINKISDNDEVNVICKNNICVYGLDSVGSENNSKVKKIINDVSVIISTNDDAQKQSKSNDDVPVVKGYKGVRPEDVNPEVDDENDAAKSKNDNEQPSIIVTHLPKAGGTVIIDTDKQGLEKPSFVLQPPIYQAPNWRNNINWKNRIPNIDQSSPPNYHNQRPQPPRQYYHHELSEIPNTQYYENDIPIIGSRRDSGYETYNRDVRIPSGFASNWRPIVPQAPTDHYHYNVNGRANDFSGWSPRYVTVCSCSRKPVIGNGSVQPRKPNPWYPETTTQMHIDDKLAKPFSKTTTSNK